MGGGARLTVLLEGGDAESRSRALASAPSRERADAAAPAADGAFRFRLSTTQASPIRVHREHVDVPSLVTMSHFVLLSRQALHE